MINEKLFESLVRDYGDECVKITQNLIDKAYQSGRTDAFQEIAYSDSVIKEPFETLAYNKGREDGAREFVKWLANGNTFIRRIGSEKMKTIDELLSEWQKGVSNDNYNFDVGM